MSGIRSMKPIVLAGWAVLAFAAGFVFLNLRAVPSARDISSSDRRFTSRPQEPAPAEARSSRKSLALLADPRAQIARHIAARNAVGIQTVVRKWFADDPNMLLGWLESQKSYQSLQPALAQVAKDISASGSPADALKWAELMEIGPDRDQALFEIYATGRRYRSLTEAQIRAAPFPPERIDALLSGAADD